MTSSYVMPQVYLRNDLPRPLRVALSRKFTRERNTMVPVDAEVCLPLPVLDSRELYLWRSPRTLVGGRALRKALEDEEEAFSDIGDRVLVPITPTTFDRKKRVAERHSSRSESICVFLCTGKVRPQSKAVQMSSWLVLL